jgi:two-component system cell cycle sensor histidine kinase/response regulator CckA
MAIEDNKLTPFYKALIENSRDIIKMLDANGVVQFQSFSISTIFGYEPDELVGTLVFERVHPEDRDRAIGILTRTLNGETLSPFIVRFQHKNGSWRYVEVMAHLVDDTVSGVLLNSRDVTEFEETSRARRLADASFEAAFNASSAINSISVAETGEFVNVNEGWMAALGWSREEAIGRTANDLNIWGGRENRVKTLRKFKEKGSLRGLRVELTKKSGERMTVLLDATYLHLPIGTRLYFSALDITERERTEEKLRQSQRLDAIGHLTGGIAHDFNNLLTVILGHAELSQADQSISDQVLESLIAIERATITGANLVQQLLSFSRKQNLLPKTFKLFDHIEAMRPLLQTTVAKDIALEIKCQQNDCFCCLDPQQLDNAILNMAINARDAMPDGGVLEFVVDDIALSAAEAARQGLLPGDFVRLRVKDTGIGMSDETRKHAFEPYYTTKQDQGGTGLGLSMVFGFVAQSGGLINIESEPSATTISILLPRVDEPSSAEHPAAAKRKKAKTGQRVLLVEDNHEVRLSVAKMLDALGFQVTSVGTAQEAEISESLTFDLLVCDVMLPGNQKGPDIAKKFQTAQSGIAVLYMSGYQQGILTTADLESSSVSFIQKPFSKEDLTSKVLGLLAGIEGGDKPAQRFSND